MTIRKATNSDVKKINFFLTELIHDEKKYDKNINEGCIVQHYYEQVIDRDNACVLVAMDGEEIVGYLYGYILDSGDAYIDSIAELDAMYVNENSRRQGIGQMLISAFEDWAKKEKVKYIQLKVCDENAKAVSLYNKNHYNSIKTIMIKEIGEL